MNLTKLYCIEKFPKNWEEEYEKRTNTLASLESLDRLAESRPEKIYMTRQQLAQYRKLVGSAMYTGKKFGMGTIPYTGASQLLYMGIPIEVKK